MDNRSEKYVTAVDRFLSESVDLVDVDIFARETTGRLRGGGRHSWHTPLSKGLEYTLWLESDSGGMLPVGLLAGRVWGLKARVAYSALKLARSEIVLEGTRARWTLRWNGQPLGTIEPSYALFGLVLRKTTIRARDGTLVCTQRLPFLVPESPWRRDCCGEFVFPDGARQKFVVNARQRARSRKCEDTTGRQSRGWGLASVGGMLVGGVRASGLFAYPPAAETIPLLPELSASVTAGADESRALLVFGAIWAQIAWA